MQELFQYIYDAQGVASVLEALVLWMAEGELNISPVGRHINREFSYLRLFYSLL